MNPKIIPYIIAAVSVSILAAGAYGGYRVAKLTSVDLVCHGRIVFNDADEEQQMTDAVPSSAIIDKHMTTVTAQVSPGILLDEMPIPQKKPKVRK